MKPLKTLLGIVLYEQKIGVSEVELVDARITVHKCAEYSLSQGVTIENLSADVAGFKSFLQDNGFRAKKAVVGLSTKHMISTFLEIPKIADPQVRHDTIKINLERKIEVDFSEVVFDYDENQPVSKNGFLIIILLKRMLTSVLELLKDVRITPLQITNTSLGLDLRTHSGVTCNIVEFPSSFELCLFQDDCLNAIQRIAKDPKQTLNLELAQKITRQVNRICWDLGIDQTVQYCIWSPFRQTLTEKKDLQQFLGKVEYRTLTYSLSSPLCNLAVELAGHVLHGSSDRINFVNGRHEAAKPTLVSQWYRKGIALAAGILIFIGIFFAGWHADQKSIANYQQQLESMKDSVEVAEKMINQLSYAKQWFHQEPKCLEILRELTLCFPENSDIWLTSLAIDESFNQILSGQTVSEDAVLDVAESLQSKDVFKDIKILYIRKMGEGSEIMTFAINLRYRKDL